MSPDTCAHMFLVPVGLGADAEQSRQSIRRALNGITTGNPACLALQASSIPHMIYGNGYMGRLVGGHAARTLGGRHCCNHGAYAG